MKFIEAFFARTFALWLWALLLVACGEETAKRDGIVVAVYTDLEVGTELTSLVANVLKDDGGPAGSPYPFSFDGQPAGSNFLLSFGVERGESAEMKLKLTGYRRGADGEPQVVIEQLVRARFLRGQTGLVQTLLSRNCLDVLVCTGEQSCNPNTGNCANVELSSVTPRHNESDERITWLPTGYGVIDPLENDGGNDAGPDVVDSGSDAGPDAGPESPCKAGDGTCPEGCTFADDADCLRPAGEACGAAVDCESGSCLGSFCCAAVCSTEHVTPSCRGGDCQAGLCETNYGDCNSDKATDGCETLLTNEPMHCGSCGHECRYGVCQSNACVTPTFEGLKTREVELELLAGYVYGFRFSNTDSGSLASLGFLVKEVNQALVRMALFEVFDDGTSPYPQVIQSPELTVDKEEVEWIVPMTERKEMYGGEKGYWLYVIFSKDTLLYATPFKDIYWMSTAPQDFGPIAEERPDDLLAEPEDARPVPSVFFNVVPGVPSGP